MSADESRWGLKVRVWVERGGEKVLGPGRVELLEHIEPRRSISKAAKQMNMSYRRAWELVQAMNDAAGVPLVEAKPGGSGVVVRLSRPTVSNIAEVSTYRGGHLR